MRAMKRVAVAVLVAVALGWVAYGSRNDATRGAQATAQSASVAESADSEPDAAPASPDATPIASPRETASLAPAPVASVAHDAPLPPLDEPFAQHLDELRRRAQDGDAPAACRLGMELYQCQRLGDIQAILAAQLADTGGDDPAQRENVESFQASVARLEAQCRGVVPLDALESFRAHLTAARGGVVQAQLQLAAFPPLAHIDVIDHPEIWRQWRDAAMPALEAALAAGEPRAAYALASAYDERFVSPFAPRLAPVDPYRAYTYRRLVTLIAQRSGHSNLQHEATDEEKAGATLTEPQRRAAAAEAQRLFDRHFSAFAPGTTIGGTDGDDFAACER